MTRGLPGSASLPCPAPQESLFPARVVYDLLFFFIVIIIVLNLIFGVIIDTFADLRSEKQKKEEILKTTCFICGEALFLSCRGHGGLGWGACGLGHYLGQWQPQFGPSRVLVATGAALGLMA